MIKLRYLLIMSIIGIFSLLILYYFSEPKLLKINQIDLTYLEKNIKLQGKVIDIQESTSFQTITLKDSTGKIKVFVYNNKLALKNNSQIRVIGKIQDYNSKIELVANKITEISPFSH
jgi:aspartyl/asparaginyl-tRNA synthetase